MKGDFLNVVKSNLSSVAFTVSKHSPEILIISGAIGIGVAAVWACKKSMELPEVIEDTSSKLEELHIALEEENEITEAEFSKEATKVYVEAGIKLVKMYGPPLALGVLSMGTVFASNNILRQRNASLAAAYATLNSVFKRYRRNVVDTYGEEVDRNMRYNVKKHTVEVTEIDEKGKEKKRKQDINVTSLDPTQYSEFARYFNEDCAEWDKDQEYCLTFLKCQEASANNILQSRGHMFLNEVYDMLGIPRTKAGNIVGWIFDEAHPIGDNFISFGIFDYWKENSTSEGFVNGYEPVILLDFNVDGDIINKI